MKSPSTYQHNPVAAWLGLAVVLIVLDQITKIWIVNHYQLGDSTYVTEFFNLVRAHNTGAAFSFLSEAGGWQRWFFMGLGFTASSVMIWLLKNHATQRLFAFALACLLGGAIGNVIDRVAYGYVVDFLDFHWIFLENFFYRGHFPAFNVADMAITLGAICLLIEEFRPSAAAKRG